MTNSSEVALAIKNDCYYVLMNGISENIKSINHLINESDFYQKEEGILLHWKSIKWSFPSVNVFMESLNKINPNHWLLIELDQDLDNHKISGLWINNPFKLKLDHGISMDCNFCQVSIVIK